jgi:hypothetical protein
MRNEETPKVRAARFVFQNLLQKEHVFEYCHADRAARRFDPINNSLTLSERPLADAAP